MDEVRTLREEIAAIIYSAVAEVSNEPNLVDTNEAADAILSLPTIREALELYERDAPVGMGFSSVKVRDLPQYRGFSPGSPPKP